MGLPEQAPAAAIHFLNQAPAAANCPLSAGEVVRRTMRNLLFFGSDAALRDRALGNCVAFAGSVPGYRLDFLPDDSFWRCVDGAGRKETAAKP